MRQIKSYDKNKTKGTLYLVPTPIGNLEDMTYRALNTLKMVDVIASEDTRHTQKLLNHFNIATPQKSLHEHNYKERVPELISLLTEGKNIAQVSDAGMPSISDPGHELVVACLEEEIAVTPLPGPTAGATALIASGLPCQPYLFYGFLPRKKKDAIQVLTTLKESVATLIFYESPYRILQTLKHFGQVFSLQRKVVLCRELTKLHEEFTSGTLEELIAYYEEHEVKGECCLMIEGATGLEEIKTEYDALSLVEHVSLLIDEGMTSKEAIKTVAKARGLRKQEVYQAYHEQ